MLGSKDHGTGSGISSTVPFAKVEQAPELNQLLKLRTVLGFSKHAAMAIAPKSLVAYAADAVVMIWDWANDKQICLKGHRYPIISLRFTPDGHYLLSADVEEFLL
jgi:WD40 repeat protein